VREARASGRAAAAAAVVAFHASSLFISRYRCNLFHSLNLFSLDCLIWSNLSLEINIKDQIESDLEDEHFFEMLRALRFEVDYEIIERDDLLNGYVEEYDPEIEKEQAILIELAPEMWEKERETSK
jgi:hypothetical protein